MPFPFQFGSPTPVIITDQSGSTGTSANLPVVDAADGAVNAIAPVFAIQVGWLDGSGKLQAVSAANPLPTSSSGSSALTTTSVPIQLSASGTLVALVALKSIRVIALSLMASGNVNVKFQSHVSPTDLTGLYYLIANTGFVLPYNPSGWFQSLSGEALDINLSAGIAIGGVLTYVAV